MSDDEGVRPKKAKKPPKHESTIILMDVGSNMNQPVPGTSAMAIDYAKEVVDWILTRKIFTESPDEFVLVLFGSKETKNPCSGNENIYFCEEEMQTAKIDWLKLIEKEIKPSKTVEGDFLAALIDAISFMRSHLESVPDGVITGSNILLVSNLDVHKLSGDEQDKEDAKAIVNGITSLNIDFSVIGPSIQRGQNEKKNKDSSAVSQESQTKEEDEEKINELILGDIVERCKGVIYPFKDALLMLRHFVPRRVTLRGQKFFLEISENVSLPLLLYKKVQPADMNLKFKKFDVLSNVEIKRETVYEKPLAVEDDAQVDEITHKEKSKDQTFLTKEDVVKGYTFGATIVPFNEADKQEYGWKKEARSMRLMQFAKCSEVLQHYFMNGSAYYCLPPADDKVDMGIFD